MDADRAREEAIIEDAKSALSRLTPDMAALEAEIAAAPERAPALEAAWKLAEAARGLGELPGGFQGGRPLWRGGDLGFQGRHVRCQARQGGLGVLDDGFLAGAVGVHTAQVFGEAGGVGLDALALMVEPVTFHRQPMQDRRGGHFLVTHGPDGLFGLDGVDRGGRRVPRCGLDRAHGVSRLGFGALERLERLAPAGVKHGGLQDADLRGDLLVGFRLTRLAPQAGGGGVQLADEILQASQVRLGGAQPELGLVATTVQTRNARGLFQDQAAVLGLGGDQL